jgi:hypothetical protein
MLPGRVDAVPSGRDGGGEVFRGEWGWGDCCFRAREGAGRGAGVAAGQVEVARPPRGCVGAVPSAGGDGEVGAAAGVAGGAGRGGVSSLSLTRSIFPLQPPLPFYV